MDGVAKNIAHISNELLQYVGQCNKWSQNVVFSSLSLHHLLTLLQLGSKGKTYEALREVTGIDCDSLEQSKEVNIKFFGDQSDKKQNATNQCSLDLNSGVFLGCDLEKNFVSIVTKYFDAAVKQVDFRDVKGSVAIIDEWISEVTNHLIKDMIKKADCITEQTSLVLVTTAFFKAKWICPFDTYNTKPGNFYQNQHSTINVEYMHQTDIFKYFHDTERDIQSLQLPFNDRKYVAVVILPPVKANNEFYREYFQFESIEKILVDLKNSPYESINVSLPKFSFECDLNLKEFLCDKQSDGGKNLGIIFDPTKCDFSGITKEGIFVSEIIQSAKLIVDEKETVAAAATAAIMLRCCYRDRVLNFEANRPFLYLIMDVENHIPIFTAFVSHPNVV